MPNPQLISPRVRRHVREALVDVVLREITDMFQDEGFVPDLDHRPNIGGERRTLVEQFYVNIDWSSLDDCKRFLRIAEQTRDRRATTAALSIDNDEVAWCNKWVEDFEELLRRDGLGSDDNGAIVFDADLDLNLSFEHLPAETAVRRHVSLMREKVESDPYASIGSAKSAVESALSHAISVLGLDVQGRQDMPDLIKAVHSALGLHSASLAPDKKGAKSILKTLGGLSSVATGIVELRNLYGDGHGRAVDAKGLTSRHSKLVMRSTEAYVGMILDTLEAPNAPWRRPDDA